MEFDVVIVGAGPGGLACSHELLDRDPDARIAVVEAGRRHVRRICPVDRGRPCVACGGVCNVVSGFGGCMHYGDGVKLSLMPSGRRLIDLFGDAAFDLSADAFELFSRYAGTRPELVGHNVAQEVLDVLDAQQLELRQYPVAVLGESQLSRVIEGLWERLAPRVDMRLKTQVSAVRPNGGGYDVEIRHRHGTDTLSAPNVVIATGRRGLVSSQRLLREVGVPMRPPDFSLGVRLEMRADYLRATGLSHPDMKVTQRERHADKIKTFCFCGGTNGGRIKFTHYQDAFAGEIITLDGHETLDRVAGGRPLAGNFGLLCQATALDADVDESEDVERVLLAPYRAMNGGRPVVQTLADFRARRAPATDWPELSASLPFEPSVQNLACAPVHALFSDRQHASLVSAFDNLMTPMLVLGGYDIAPMDLADEILVVGLEIEFLWSRVVVSEDCETPQPGLFVVGDAAGVAQGVVQAAMMGMRVGRAVARTRAPAGAAASAPAGRARRAAVG